MAPAAAAAMVQQQAEHHQVATRQADALQASMP
jgi:hypothetical protein